MSRNLALGALLVAVALAVVAFPFREHWWGGLLLAIAEAGVVGGLADWFAVTALFRHPLGLPIPHTALVPANWELLAKRVGTMVGDRVLTKQYVTEEIGRLDLAGLLASGASRITRADLEGLTRTVARWLLTEVSPGATGELFGRARRFLSEQPLSPLLADLLDAVRGHAWHDRAITAVASAVGDALDRPAFRDAMRDIVDGLVDRYRSGMRIGPRLWLTVADFLGVIDRDRLVEALQNALHEVARDPTHPLRTQVTVALDELPARLRTDPELVARIEAVKVKALASPAVARLLEEATAAVRQALAADLVAPDSEIVDWIADRLERARQTLLTDAQLREELGAWVRARVIEFIEHHHGSLARFIENGVRALGPEGAVRLIEEHAGDDLQFIRVNGTVVGGLAGGVIYMVHLLLRA